MWIGFSAVEGSEAGPAVRAEAFSLESCQNWLPGEPHPATAERCVRLGPAGQCNTDLCSVPHSYVCELRPGGAPGPLEGWGSPCVLELDQLPWPSGGAPLHAPRGLLLSWPGQSHPSSQAHSLAVQCPLGVTEHLWSQAEPAPNGTDKAGVGSWEATARGLSPRSGPASGP